MTTPALSPSALTPVEVLPVRGEDTRFNTRFFYGSIGVAASLALTLLFYWSLRLNSSIASLVSNIAGVPLYFWPYVLLTLGTIVLFGVSVALFVYRWRRFGRPRLWGQTGTGAGALVGFAASACPVCGSAILSALGIAGGLAAFPLQGLELKALSLGFMALPVLLLRRDIRRLACDTTACPMPRDASYQKKDYPWLLGALGLSALLLFVGWSLLKSDPFIVKIAAASNGKILNPDDNRLYGANVSSKNNPLFDEVVAKVLPEQGFQSRIALRDSAVKLVKAGVIDRAKFEALYEDRGSLPAELKTALDQSSDVPILLTRENANYYVNLLWPLGLANFMSTNKDSPVNGKSLFNFASTGGWNLGNEENGGAYFNKFPIVPLTSEQEALVTKIAQNTYRPCCNNSTFFQDCNHGSALLGLLQIGASQSLTAEELYREALAFNAFWFPHNYIQTALYFKAVKGIEWENIDPKLALGKDYSTISGWSGTVAKEVASRGLVSQTQGGAGCGV